MQEILPYKQMVFVHPRICPIEWDTQTFLGFWDTNGSPNLNQMTRPYYNKQKKENLPNCRLCCPSLPRRKLKENEKTDKYLDLARKLKKKNCVTWKYGYTNYRWCSGTVNKGLLKGLEDVEIRGWMETIQTTALLRSTRILRRALENWGDLLSFTPQWKTNSLTLM